MKPAGEAKIQISVAQPAQCTDQKALCDSDGMLLHNHPRVVIPGPQPNNPATGAPTISGTPLVGQTLTADTSVIVDADGLTSTAFNFQWVSNEGTADADIPGAADSVYTLVASDIGKVLKVRVSLTDDAGNEETLTSAATIAVARPRLTVSLESATTTPTTHDGSTAFNFHIRFSEEFSLGYITLKDHALLVNLGTVLNAQRLARGSNIGWKITVRPDGNGDVVITLPEAEDCAANGAICTEDGGKLSNRLVVTVSGPGQ